MTRITASVIAIAATFGAPARAQLATPERAAVTARLPAVDLEALRREVAQARARDPRPFADVASIVSLAPELNARARARRAPIALYVANLGPNALMPALEMLGLDLPRGIPAAEVPAIRRELVEAVGLLRDPRALRVLSAIVDDASADAETTRTATEAIARIGTQEAAEKVIAVLAGATLPERARAVVAGMGECRRLRVVEAIAERLLTTDDEETARAAARSLGRAGNAWVWPTLADRGEELRIREVAARALVDAFVRREGDVRTAAAKALLVVDAPRTAAIVADAKKRASPETAKALDALSARLARNPARTR